MFYKPNLATVVLLVSVLLGLSASCALFRPVSPAPRTYGNVFEANDAYPCAMVTFSAAPTYLDFERSNSDGEERLAYILKTTAKPQYSYTLTKVHNASGNDEWAMVPVAEQFDSSEKLYERTEGNEYATRSAVIYTQTRKDGVYLEGLIGEYIGTDDALFFTISRAIIRKSDATTVSEWRTSRTGVNMLADMTRQMDWFFSRLAVTGCVDDINVRKTILK
ncbi:hypothetical protein RsTz2092_11100 [Deferribacterales bacterium RsTz2092]|nr:hypothetical protein AGMMS49941_09320 [Deferribacterales bacterium]